MGVLFTVLDNVLLERQFLAIMLQYSKFVCVAGTATVQALFSLFSRRRTC